MLISVCALFIDKILGTHALNTVLQWYGQQLCNLATCYISSIGMLPIPACQYMHMTV